MKAECKFLELCLLQRSAKVRSSALLAISSFQLPSQNVKNICQLLFLEMEERVGCVCERNKQNFWGNMRRPLDSLNKYTKYLQKLLGDIAILAICKY